MQEQPPNAIKVNPYAAGPNLPPVLTIILV